MSVSLALEESFGRAQWVQIVNYESHNGRWGPPTQITAATEKALREQEDCDLNALEEGIENTHGELIAENRKSRVSRRGQG